MTEREKLAHDLRAPLARAITVAKLLREEPDCRDHFPLLEAALADLDRLIRAFVEKENQT